MSKSRVLSLASVTLSIYNETFGRISLGGGGKAIGSVSYSFTDRIFAMQTTADGGASISHKKAEAGTVSIAFLQTSPQIPELVKFIKFCRDNPELAESYITARDITGNIPFQANGVFPEGIPDNGVTANPSDRTFNFLATQIIPDESEEGVN